LVYPSAAAATWAGFERVTGSLAGRSGRIVLRNDATFEGGTVTTSCSVVPGSGTGELEGLRGHGGFTFRMGEPPPGTSPPGSDRAPGRGAVL
jgi:hypothetical protein